MNFDRIHPSGLSNQPVVQRVLAAKRAYATRRVPLLSMCRIDAGPEVPPRAGDLMLARVVRVGRPAHLEGTDSRPATLFAGDEVVVACAAPGAFEQADARAPGSPGRCHLVAVGGLAGVSLAPHDGPVAPTELQPIGLLTDEHGLVANLGDHALRADRLQGTHRPLTIAMLGASIHAGKTASAAHLIRGLTRAGFRVGAAQVTGAMSGRAPALFRDAGAVRVADFSDAGIACTGPLGADALAGAARRLVAHLAHAKVQAIVLNVADGLFAPPTAALLRSERFRDLVDATLFASADATGAGTGARWLAAAGWAPLALAGSMAGLPPAQRQAAACGLPVLGLDDLGDPQTARGLWALSAARRTAGLAA